MYWRWARHLAQYECTAPPSIANQHTWDPVHNPNVLMQKEVERSSARAEIENILYEKFSKRCSLLDHVLYKNPNTASGVRLSPLKSTVELKGINISNGHFVVPSDHYGILVEFEVTSGSTTVQKSSRR